jgi:hypothetical protein
MQADSKSDELIRQRIRDGERSQDVFKDFLALGLEPEHIEDVINGVIRGIDLVLGKLEPDEKPETLEDRFGGKKDGR